MTCADCVDALILEAHQSIATSCNFSRFGQDMMDRGKLRDTDFRKVDPSAPAMAPMAPMAPAPSGGDHAVPRSQPGGPGGPGGYGNGTAQPMSMSSANGTNGSNGSQVPPSSGHSGGNAGNAGHPVMLWMLLADFRRKGEHDIDRVVSMCTCI